MNTPPADFLLTSARWLFFYGMFLFCVALAAVMHDPKSGQFGMNPAANRLKNILVGVGFSDCSKAALAQPARLAQWNDVRLHVFHVLESLVMTDELEKRPARLHRRSVSPRRAVFGSRDQTTQPRPAGDSRNPLTILTRTPADHNLFAS